MPFRYVVVFLAVLGLSACGGGSSSGSSDAVQSNTPPPAPELSSLAPGSISLTLDQSEVSDETIGFSNTGNAVLTYSVSTPSWISVTSGGSGNVAANANVEVGLRIQCDQGSQSGSVVVTTNDADEAEVAIPVTLTCNESDHEVARLILNQATRSFDSDESASMFIDTLADRDLLVRVFVTGSGVSPQGEVVLQTGSTETRFPLVVPTSISSTPADESLLSGSHYAIIPGSAVAEGAQLFVDVAGVRFPSTNLDLQVADPGALDITLVPVTFAGQTPSLDPDVYLRQTLQQLPIGAYNVSVRTPYVFAGPYDLDQLLDDITDLRAADGSSNLYHAVIIPPPSSGAQTAGLGYVGFPVSVSIDLSGSQNIVSHEIGHNLDLRHAPACDAPNTDPSFPISDGSVVNWGYDIRNRVLVEPTATKKDLMSYCNDVWIGRYSFSKALAYRVSVAPSGLSGGGAAEKTLAIRGRLGPSGVLDVSFIESNGLLREARQLEPTHRIEAWDKNGQKVLDHSFRPIAVEHGRLGERAFFLTAPIPEQDIDHYAISEIGGRLIDSASVAAVTGLTVSEGRVHWQEAEGYRVMMRNADGEVISFANRTGTSVPQSAKSVELVGPRMSNRLLPQFRRVLD